MSTDVLADWKKSKFIIAPAQWLEGYDLHQLVVLTDIKFWTENYDELKKWCDENFSSVEGMTVNIPNKRILTLFVLRWA